MTTATYTRRAFLGALSRRHEPRVLPPGFIVGLLDACTGCGACVEACPTGIIALPDRVPSLDFAAGECTFCGDCAKACPEPLFEDARPTRFAHVARISDTCFARHGIACGSCRDVCQEQAIRLRPQRGGLFIPDIDEAACTGCGACIGVCPAAAIGVAAGTPMMEHARG